MARGAAAPCQADWAVGGDRLILRYHSPAGEDDMPGTVDAQVQYILEEDNTLTIRYHAVTGCGDPHQPDQPQLFQSGRKRGRAEPHSAPLGEKLYPGG